MLKVPEVETTMTLGQLLTQLEKFLAVNPSRRDVGVRLQDGPLTTITAQRGVNGLELVLHNQP